jgi:ribonucleoside-triphosphate reductase (thioredoxin)
MRNTTLNPQDATIDDLSERMIRILSDLTCFDKYAQYKKEYRRRETWEEIAVRQMTMHWEKFSRWPTNPLDDPWFHRTFMETFALLQERAVCGSMRAAQFAGKPIEINNARLYNCTFHHAKNIRVFREEMFLLLSGCGCGASIQFHHVDALPRLVRPTAEYTHVVEDSIEGWADAVNELMMAAFGERGGLWPVFDLSRIRPRGARLVTSGGKAPGPEPLRICLEKIRTRLEELLSRNILYLRPIDAGDILNYIADAVRSGGIRRAAKILLFSWGDRQMRQSKGNYEITHLDVLGDTLWDPDGKKVYLQYTDPTWPDEVLSKEIELGGSDFKRLVESGTLPWYYFHPERGRSNISAAALHGAVTEAEFRAFMAEVEANESGEPGIYWTYDLEEGPNPCVEIGLKADQCCNLTTMNGRKIRTQGDFNRIARAAAFLGTLQACYTDFTYLDREWKMRCERERLLGVSISGYATETVLVLDEQEAMDAAMECNERAAQVLGIAPAARVACMKPDGNSACFLGTSSGMGAWHSPYYLRRQRTGKDTAFWAYMSQNFPDACEDDFFDPNGGIIAVPIKAPEGAILREDESALDSLNRLKRLSDNWVRAGHRSGNNRHNVSCTINLKPEEWGPVTDWMWENRHSYHGIAVLPFDGGTYKQTPFEAISAKEWERRARLLVGCDIYSFPEEDDDTDLFGEIACGGGKCEI